MPSGRPQRDVDEVLVEHVHERGVLPQQVRHVSEVHGQTMLTSGGVQVVTVTTSDDRGHSHARNVRATDLENAVLWSSATTTLPRPGMLLVKVSAVYSRQGLSWTTTT